MKKSLWADDVFIFGSSTEQQLHVLRCRDKGLLLSWDPCGEITGTVCQAATADPGI